MLDFPCRLSRSTGSTILSRAWTSLTQPRSFQLPFAILPGIPCTHAVSDDACCSILPGMPCTHTVSDDACCSIQQSCCLSNNLAGSHAPVTFAHTDLIARLTVRDDSSLHWLERILVHPSCLSVSSLPLTSS